MASFELLIKTVEIMGWLMTAETPQEQSAKIGNFLTGMGSEYNRYGSMLVVAPAEHADDKPNVCLRAFYHSNTGCADKPVFHDGKLTGPYLCETLEMAVRLAVFSLLQNIVTANNIFMCVSDDQSDIPSIYSFDRILEDYSSDKLTDRQTICKVNTNVSSCSGWVTLADINDYIDRMMLSIMTKECSE